MKYLFRVIGLYIGMYALGKLMWVSVPAILPTPFDYSTLEFFSSKNKGKGRNKRKRF